MLHRVRRLFRRRRARDPVPPALPRHPEFGLRVEAGDSLTIKDLSISLEDLNELEGVVQRTFKMRIAPAADEFSCGASFALSRRLDTARFNVDKHRVDIVENGSVIEVALGAEAADPLRAAYEVAETTLDLIAVQSFRITDLFEPLREYSIWHRRGGMTTLRVTTTARLAARMRSSAVVLDPAGNERTQPSRPPMAWHPSHAYFRRSQATDDLHEAYRNLFLATEALLSTVYPWNPGLGETKWLTLALKHVAEGYELDVSRYVERPGGNVYRRFINEQYRARRCALFHAKVTERPTVPGDVATRDELIAAARRLGQLYVQLGKRVTGARFAGSAMTYAMFEKMMDTFAGAPMFLSDSEQPDLTNSPQSTAVLAKRAYGQPGLHQIIGRWTSDVLPARVVRAGVLVRSEEAWTEGVTGLLDVDTQGVDEFEFVIQNELGNADNLREWFL